MEKNYQVKARLVCSVAFLIMAVLWVCFSGSCKTTDGDVLAAKAMGFVSPLRQERVYNGEPQPIEAQSSTATAPPFVVTYYTSEEACAAREGGKSKAPAGAGLYYVRVEQGGGLDPELSVIVEYLIEKAQVTILADEKQSAYYNGDPKRVMAVSEPPLTLSFSYYPNAEAREAAARAFSQPGGDTEVSASSALKGFTRVGRAPIEQGVYYVLVFFPGDENCHAAYKEVEFTIGPPVRRR
jgi:hypothetical protein